MDGAALHEGPALDRREREGLDHFVVRAALVHEGLHETVWSFDLEVGAVEAEALPVGCLLDQSVATPDVEVDLAHDEFELAWTPPSAQVLSFGEQLKYEVGVSCDPATERNRWLVRRHLDLEFIHLGPLRPMIWCTRRGGRSCPPRTPDRCPATPPRP